MKFSKNILISLILMHSLYSYAQNDSTVFHLADESPIYSQGEDELRKIMLQKRDELKNKYNVECFDSIKKQIIVGFIVDTLGNAINHKIIRGFDSIIDEEALKSLIRLDLKWIPGEYKLKKVPVSMYLPFNFCNQKMEK